jgi:hypothetical protein
MKFNPEITLGQIATVVAVLVSAATLVYAWRKDRTVRVRERADRVRGAAGVALAGLGRWKEVMSWFYVECQPLLVAAASAYGSTRNSNEVRDELWKESQELRVGTLKRIFDEKLEMSYADLLRYDASAQEWFLQICANLKVADEASFDSYLMGLQRAMQRINPNSGAAALGNELRTEALWRRRVLNEDLARIAKPAEDVLTEIIRRTDRSLLMQVSSALNRETFPERMESPN